MDYKLVYTKTAEKDLAKLNEAVAVRILKKVAYYAAQDDPLRNAKKLKGFKCDTFRYRIGDYRVLFRFDENTKKLVVLIVLRVAHRKDVYDL